MKKCEFIIIIIIILSLFGPALKGGRFILSGNGFLFSP